MTSAVGAVHRVGGALQTAVSGDHEETARPNDSAATPNQHRMIKYRCMWRRQCQTEENSIVVRMEIHGSLGASRLTVVHSLFISLMRPRAAAYHTLSWASSFGLEVVQSSGLLLRLIATLVDVPPYESAL